MAEIINIVTVEDVDALISSQARTRLFAKNGGSTVDLVFQSRIVAQANSRIRVLTHRAFPDGLYQTGDTLDPDVVGRGVDLVLGLAASRHLATEETSNYIRLKAQAEEFFKSLNRDRDASAPGSSQGAPLPRPTVNNLTDAQGQPTNPYVRNASQQDTSGF